MVGSGTTLIEARLLNRNAIGYNINQRAIDITKERLAFPMDIQSSQVVCIGDVRNLHELADNSLDLIITHPPYANIIKYSDNQNPDDLSSTLSVPTFLDELEKGIRELYRMPKPNRYCVILRTAN
jgi:DNA modification methylase